MCRSEWICPRLSTDRIFCNRDAQWRLTARLTCAGLMHRQPLPSAFTRSDCSSRQQIAHGAQHPSVMKACRSLSRGSIASCRRSRAGDDNAEIFLSIGTYQRVRSVAGIPAPTSVPDPDNRGSQIQLPARFKPQQADAHPTFEGQFSRNRMLSRQVTWVQQPRKGAYQSSSGE